MLGAYEHCMNQVATGDIGQNLKNFPAVPNNLKRPHSHLQS